MVKVCPYCSHVNVTELKNIIGEENVKTGCIGACRRFQTESVGVVNNEFIIKQTEQEFLDFCKSSK